MSKIRPDNEIMKIISQLSLGLPDSLTQISLLSCYNYPSIKTILIILVTVSAMCFPSQSSARDIFTDIPEPVTKLIIKHDILSTIIDAQKLLVEHYDRHKTLLNKEDLALWEQHVRYARSADTEQPDNLETSNPTSQFVFGTDILNLYDFRSLAISLKRLKTKIAQLECNKYEIQHLDLGGQNLDLHSLDLHNFFVFYLRNVHLVCNSPVLWVPSKLTKRIPRLLHDCLEGIESFKCLHEYYENRPRAFAQSSKLPQFLNSLAFKYLSVAFDAKYLCMVESEYLASRNDLKQVFYPELSQLHEYIILIIRARLSFC